MSSGSVGYCSGDLKVAGNLRVLGTIEGGSGAPGSAVTYIETDSTDAVPVGGLGPVGIKSAIGGVVQTVGLGDVVFLDAPLAATSFAGNTGTAAPVSHEIRIVGAGGVTTAATGNTVTISSAAAPADLVKWIRVPTGFGSSQVSLEGAIAVATEYSQGLRFAGAIESGSGPTAVSTLYAASTCIEDIQTYDVAGNPKDKFTGDAQGAAFPLGPVADHVTLSMQDGQYISLDPVGTGGSVLQINNTGVWSCTGGLQGTTLSNGPVSFLPGVGVAVTSAETPGANPGGSVTISNTGVTQLIAGDFMKISQGTGTVTLGPDRNVCCFIQGDAGTPAVAGEGLLGDNYISIVGGNGISTLSEEANSSVVIGNTGVLSITPGAGLSVSGGGRGAVTMANTGVLSITPSAGLSVNSTTGGVSMANTGVLSCIASGGIIGSPGHQYLTGTIQCVGMTPGISIESKVVDSDQLLEITNTGVTSVTALGGVSVSAATGAPQISFNAPAAVFLPSLATPVWGTGQGGNGAFNASGSEQPWEAGNTGEAPWLSTSIVYKGATSTAGEYAALALSPSQITGSMLFQTTSVGSPYFPIILVHPNLSPRSVVLFGAGAASGYQIVSAFSAPITIAGISYSHYCICPTDTMPRDVVVTVPFMMFNL